ncbi:PAS domain S-box protein [Cupriavidus sp. 2TAF22]|uniref:PAS domain-containing hybrid sensor histidine kinase/response regulator n=1 Tax=unclassified Cupriavidus TaxID=2640874 RepID=UPI003F92D12E
MNAPAPAAPSQAPRPHGASISPDVSFREVVESIVDYAIFTLDTAGRVTSWNAGARKMKGYADNEILGEHFSRFYTEEAIARGWPEHELRVARLEGRFEDEGWRVRADGTRFWANVIITAIRDADGQESGFIKVTRDLTEHRRTEEALRQSEEILRLLVEGVKDYAIFLLDPHGCVISWNSGATLIKGYTRQEILGRHFSLFYLPEDIADGKPERELATARRVGSVEDEGWRVRKDGSTFWANVIITPVYDSTAVLRGFAKVTRDMTERRRTEELERSSRRMTEFLATLSHELRNPLAPVRNALNAMKLLPDGRHVVERCHALIDRQITLLTRLVDDLLDVGRISSGKIELRLAPVEFRELVSHAIEATAPVLEARAQTVRVDLPPVPVVLTADRTRLVQVLQNLLVNASKFSPEHSIIDVAGTLGERHLMFRISDQGAGISADALDSIFDLFVQVNRWTSNHSGGLGIGLSLSRSLVELHGGTISAASAGLGKGSTFTVRLPYHSPPASAERASASRAAAAREACLRVLVIDDNQDSADSLSMLLTLRGHEVVTAYDAEQGILASARCHPDLALIDIAMPGMDGLAAVRALRELPACARTRFVAMTGFGQPEDRERTRAAGFHLHLVKPIDLPTLVELLAQTGQPPA